MLVSVSRSVVPDSLPPHGLQPSVHEIFQARIPEWVSHFLLQGIFPTQELNPGLLHCRQILYQLSYKESPRVHSSAGASQVALVVKNLPARRHKRRGSIPVWEDPLEEGMATRSSGFSRLDRGAWRATVHKVPKR